MRVKPARPAAAMPETAMNRASYYLASNKNPFFTNPLLLIQNTENMAALLGHL